MEINQINGYVPSVTSSERTATPQSVDTNNDLIQTKPAEKPSLPEEGAGDSSNEDTVSGSGNSAVEIRMGIRTLEMALQSSLISAMMDASTDPFASTMYDVIYQSSVNSAMQGINQFQPPEDLIPGQDGVVKPMPKAYEEVADLTDSANTTPDGIKTSA